MSDNEPEMQSGQFASRTLIIVASIFAVAAIAIAAIVTFGSHSSTTTSTSSTSRSKMAVPSTTAAPTTAAPATTLPPTTTVPPTTTSPPLPGVLVCEGSPMYEPSTLHWCTSACSSYVDNVTWTSWTPQSANGTGTYMTNDGIPNCSQGTWTAHPGFAVTLSSPATVSYCTGTGESSGLLFTYSNVWDYSLPDFKPPC